MAVSRRTVLNCLFGLEDIQKDMQVANFLNGPAADHQARKSSKWAATYDNGVKNF